MENLTVVELKKQCKSLNISLTKSDRSQKLKKDLINSLSSSKSSHLIKEGGAKRRSRKSSKKRSKRRGSRKVSRRRSRKSSRKVGSKKRGSRKKKSSRRRSRKQVGGGLFSYVREWFNSVPLSDDDTIKSNFEVSFKNDSDKNIYIKYIYTGLPHKQVDVTYKSVNGQPITYQEKDTKKKMRFNRFYNKKYTDKNGNFWTATNTIQDVIQEVIPPDTDISNFKVFMENPSLQNTKILRISDTLDTLNKNYSYFGDNDYYEGNFTLFILTVEEHETLMKQLQSSINTNPEPIIQHFGNAI